jgi:glycosyltransferase involved in cell wall biosynthesis
VREPEIRFETPETRPRPTGDTWAWPVDGEPRELFALVTILGYSRRPAVRFALDRTRTTTLTRLALTLDDLGGATNHVLSDRDPAFVIGATSDGRAIFAPDWIAWAELLGVVPKACRPYRAKTNGKVERMVRGVAYAADAPMGKPRTRDQVRPLVLGHLSNLSSNLSIEKGLAEVMHVARSARQSGLASKVVLAGPATGAPEQALVAEASSNKDVDYRGPVYGDRKEAFFDEIDVFLFPSRYRNELSPLVVWESLLRGIPVIAYEVGCLAQAASADGSLVLDPGRPFLEPTLRQLRVWMEDPDALREAQHRSREHARQERDRAIAEALSIGRRRHSYRR